MTDQEFDYDVLIIGSGFGGSVAALRLTEKGYLVGVLEAGRRFDETNLPKTSWRSKDFLFAPRLGCTGIQRIHVLPDVLILAGAGVGGGSLVYANTLYVPPKRFFEDPQWAGITDWADELAPFYDQASRMLGVVQYAGETPSDKIMKAVADDMGVGHTYTTTPVGVYFGEGPGVRAPDPFFGGKGPARDGCMQCGECMTGCRHNAKNTLPKNYLGLAEGAGAAVHPLTTVTAIRPLPDGGYAVDTERTAVRAGQGERTFTAEQVIVAAGTYNTQLLLHKMRDAGYLPNLSGMLGKLSRTNSEAILGAVADSTDVDYTEGVAITSSFYPDAETHVEPVRYGKGSNMMGLLSTVLTAEEDGTPRWRTWLRTAAKQPKAFAKSLWVKDWSEKTVIALVMQPVDNSITVSSTRSRTGRWKLTSKQGEGDPNPTYIPVAHEVALKMAEKIGGEPMGNLGDLLSAPMTAHFVGGAPIGADADHGVIDAYHRVYGHPGLHITDGAAITANLGVNPSLTITAQAERAMAYWPNKGEADHRPELGERYVPIAPVPPHAPVVPDEAPGALRLPIVEVRTQTPEPVGS
jgi:cholesterol oxidase